MSELNTNPTSWKREEQWVSRVIEYSSQYNNTSWSANQIIGRPKVYPRHGDISGAWAQGNSEDDEFIIVEFEQAVYPEQINIYETHNPGAVVKVSVRNGRNSFEWETIWETEKPHVQKRSRIFSIECTNLSIGEINQIRLNINCSAAENSCEIDCIKLIGHTSHIDISSNELSINLKELFLDNCLTDVTFQLDNGQLISSYRNILNIRSIYFNQLFDQYPLNNPQLIKITNISYEAFYQILHFIFTDTIESILTPEICLELMRKADEYFLSSIYAKAFNILKNIINKTNVLNIFIQSGLFSSSIDKNEQENIILNDVGDLCIEFIKKNRRDVYLHDQMQILTKDMLLELVQLVQ